MCEPWIIAKSGLSVEEHQRRTVENFLELRELAPEIPWIPVLQGWELRDYLVAARMYYLSGVDVREARIVGVGSVCRRQSTDQIGEVFTALNRVGINSLHGFGVKRAGLVRYGDRVNTADSMAWSYRARRAAHDRVAVGLSGSVAHCDKRNCANCKHFALEWRERVLTAVDDGQARVA
jgi:hypothetical protein